MKPEMAKLGAPIVCQCATGGGSSTAALRRNPSECSAVHSNVDRLQIFFKKKLSPHLGYITLWNATPSPYLLGNSRCELLKGHGMANWNFYREGNAKAISNAWIAEPEISQNILSSLYICLRQMRRRNKYTHMVDLTWAFCICPIWYFKGRGGCKE